MASFYRVTELPPLHDIPESDANSINNMGVVVGSSTNAVGVSEATTWSGGNFANPPKASALPKVEEYSSAAEAINDLGFIVGRIFTQGDQSYSHAVIWSGSEVDRVYSNDVHVYSRAYDINNNGWIVGFGKDDGADNAYLWQYPYTEFRLDTSPTDARAYSINNKNLAVGTINANPSVKGVVWDYFAEHPAQHPLQGGIYNSFPNDINDNNEIVGSVSDTVNKPRPVRWRNYVSHPDFLDTSFAINRGVAEAINNKGEIVGWYTLSSDNNLFNAFICNTQFVQYLTGPNGVPIPLTVSPSMINLNSLIDPNSGWHLEYAKDINDKGQIVGLGTLDGARRGFRLDPVEYVTPHDFIPVEHPNTLTAEVLKILVGLIGGNDGWVLTPNGIIRVPGNRPDRSNLSLLDMRIHIMIRNLADIVNNKQENYESRKKIVREIEKFIGSLYDRSGKTK